jgi:hypothetical protein
MEEDQGSGRLVDSDELVGALENILRFLMEDGRLLSRWLVTTPVEAQQQTTCHIVGRARRRRGKCGNGQGHGSVLKGTGPVLPTMMGNLLCGLLNGKRRFLICGAQPGP